MMRPPAAAVSLMLLAAGTAGYAQNASSNAPAGARTAHALQINGTIGDGDWDRVEPVGGFVQREPSEGGAPAFPTEVRVAADGAALHVMVDAKDPEPGRITGYLTRRDADSQSDWIHVFIDSYHDRRTAYSFSVNPAGVKKDSYWYNDDNSDDSWDAVWDVTVQRTPAGGGLTSASPTRSCDSAPAATGR
jgi:hypothetical protein